jgi:hypothetical protein
MQVPGRGVLSNVSTGRLQEDSSEPCHHWPEDGICSVYLASDQTDAGRLLHGRRGSPNPGGSQYCPQRASSCNLYCVSCPAAVWLATLEASDH